MSLRHLLHRDEGAVAVELALISPFLLLLLFAIYDFGTLFVNDMEVIHATQAAATYARKAYIVNGSVTLSNIQSAATTSTPLTVTISADPHRSALVWCGAPASDGNSVLTDSGKSPPCPSGDLTFLSIVGTAPSQSTLGSWSGFPSTLAWKILIPAQ
ncbi:hypothetical protein GCM10011611_20100 [Aliidongia dinghuensis]|uniref:TadE-like domain-containing protein n=1 Tax=Aliidongia dinghuensis TaxID=1867774 RepID=A0A8J3E1Q8_9PROT|nr:TadE/TadG family type IV pilus assembly protein [Aliidongia dinghuensis]GGF14307.1 hypothetical protein GCM10011611_20100 [Aliidongia dinghuensis]